MSRSGYGYGMCSEWSWIRWRGAVKSAIRGRRGQAFLREMKDALEAMPVKSLSANVLVSADGECCAMGAVAIKRGLDVSKVDPEEPEEVAGLFGIAEALASEIAHANDESTTCEKAEGGWLKSRLLTGEERWRLMHEWCVERLEGEHA